MKINNNTPENIIIVCDGEEFECASRNSIKIQTHKNEITVKPPEESLLSHFKIFKYDSKDSIRGNVIYFHPGFYMNYATKISFDNSVREINITRFVFAMYGIIIGSMFLPKEKVKSVPLIENNLVKKLLLLFVSLCNAPIFSFLVALIIGCTYGLFYDFDWILLIICPIILLLLWACAKGAKDLYACANPEKNYGRILEHCKEIIINRLKKHFVSFIECDFAVEKYGLQNKRRKK